MSNITVTRDIKAGVAHVWRIVEPVENHVDWMADAESIEFTSDQRRGVGTQFLCKTRVGPIRLTDTMRITRWEPNHAMGVEHIGLVTGSGVFTLTALDESTTRFEWTEKLTFPWWLGGPIGAFVGGKLVLRSIWHGNLRRLAALCERAN
jgi:hypothetical protein